jgi:predicted PurR-regulated permease PerM
MATEERDTLIAPTLIDASGIAAAAVRVSLLGLLAYWSLKVIGPFLTIALWSAMLAVALYPLFEWLARRVGSARIAAAIMTLLSLTIVIGPVTWLGFGLIGAVQLIVSGSDADVFSVPLPPDSIKEWPVIGQYAHELWTRAATDTRVIILEVVPTLKPVGTQILQLGGTVVFGLLEFLAAIIIAGFLYAPGPFLVECLSSSLRRIFGPRSDEMLKLTGATIRNVSRGVLGIAFIQSFCAGVGFVAAGTPAAGFLTFIALLLAIIQIGPTILFIPIVAWAWTAMPTPSALMFTAYMVLVSLMDNVLRPILMARGLPTPMPVILVGVIGGMIAYGISGLFLGPIVLSVAWALVLAWMREPVEQTIQAAQVTYSPGAGAWDGPDPG